MSRWVFHNLNIFYKIKESTQKTVVASSYWMIYKRMSLFLSSFLKYIYVCTFALSSTMHNVFVYIYNTFVHISVCTRNHIYMAYVYIIKYTRIIFTVVFTLFFLFYKLNLQNVFDVVSLRVYFDNRMQYMCERCT